jgi:hypothetical protein
MAVPDYVSGSGMEYSSVPLLMADLRPYNDIILTLVKRKMLQTAWLSLLSSIADCTSPAFLGSKNSTLT